jgi:nicotinamidase-related amidase
MTSSPVLIVIDVQNGFRSASMPPSNNPDCEANVLRLLEAWREMNLPIVLVRHDSISPGSVLAAGQSGNELQTGIDGKHDLLVTKSVNSAFYGEPDLQSWLQAAGYTKLVICGIQTNMCCETTARMAGNLGYDVDFVLDATRTFDLTDSDGNTVTADTLAKVTATNLHGEFATVVSTNSALAELT